MSKTPELEQAPLFSHFPRLPRLPTELRLKIWDEYYALTPPRIIPLHTGLYPGYDIAHTDDCAGSFHVASERMEVPHILRVCRESRIVGLRYISTRFEVSKSEELWKRPCAFKDPTTERSKCIYMDKSKDILHLIYDETQDKSSLVDLWDRNLNVSFGRIKYLVVDERLSQVLLGRFWFGWERIDILWTELTAFRSLSEIESDAEDDGFVPDERGIQEYRQYGGMTEVMECVRKHAIGE